MRAALFVCALAVSGCVQHSAQPVTLAPPDPFTHTRYAEDPHRGVGQFSGPRETQRASHDTTITWMLRSFERLSGGQITHQIYIIVEYRGDWRFYDGAAAYGASMPVIQINREVVSCLPDPCRVREHIAIEMPDHILTDMRQFALDFAIYGRGVRHDITLPPEYVDGYLRRVRGV